MVIGEQLPATEARHRRLLHSIAAKAEQRRLSGQLITALSVYLTALENSPHPTKGAAFRSVCIRVLLAESAMRSADGACGASRAALLGFNAIEGDMAGFLVSQPRPVSRPMG